MHNALRYGRTQNYFMKYRLNEPLQTTTITINFQREKNNEPNT